MPGLFGDDRLVQIGVGLVGIRTGLVGGSFGAQVAGLVGPVAIVADKVLV